MCAASNSHSPNKCKILLHFGRSGVSGARDSNESDGRAEKHRTFNMAQIESHCWGHRFSGISFNSTELEREAGGRGRQSKIMVKCKEHQHCKLDVDGGPDVGVRECCIDVRLLVSPISDPLLRPLVVFVDGGAHEK